VWPPAAVHLDDQVDATSGGVDRVEVERDARLPAAIEDVVHLLIQTAVGERHERRRKLRAVRLLLFARAVDQEAPPAFAIP
jgi:hypothetical protein